MWKYWSGCESTGPGCKSTGQGCESTGPGCGSTGSWMCKIVSRNGARKLGTFLRKWNLTADCLDKTVACPKFWIFGGISL